ncbi:MAG: hypothetical protein C4346_11905 [Chloroflexota bacterium]
MRARALRCRPDPGNGRAAAFAWLCSLLQPLSVSGDYTCGEANLLVVRHGSRSSGVTYQVEVSVEEVLRDLATMKEETTHWAIHLAQRLRVMTPPLEEVARTRRCCAPT